MKSDGKREMVGWDAQFFDRTGDRAGLGLAFWHPGIQSSHCAKIVIATIHWATWLDYPPLLSGISRQDTQAGWSRYGPLWKTLSFAFCFSGWDHAV